MKRRYVGNDKKLRLTRGAVYNIFVREVPFWERLAMGFKWNRRIAVENKHIWTWGNEEDYTCYYDSWSEFKENWKRAKNM